MEINDTILQKIQELHQNKPDGVRSVSIGYKTKNGERTGDIGIVFSVAEKKNKNDIPSEQVLPNSVMVDGMDLVTDVIETQEIKLMACYSGGDPEITKLQNLTSVPVALRGGQQIRQFPTAWTSLGGGSYSVRVGTLGFFATDTIDGKVVAVTNAHVVCYRKALAGQRNISEESLSPNNTGEQVPWIVNGVMYFPGGSFANNSNNALGMNRIKRYVPQSLTGLNYADAAILIPEPTYVDNNSYRMWQPTTQPVYPASLPFASTSELNNLMVTNPRLYSTGQASGPKGWGSSPSCIMRVSNVGQSTTIFDGQEGFSANWADLFTVQYEDQSTGPMAGGDSGSVVLADIGGTLKIAGLFFAGSSNQGIVCRIDRIANELQISQFTTPLNTSIPTPNFFSSDDFSTYGTQKTITRNGKTYYQIGITTQVYNS